MADKMPLPLLSTDALEAEQTEMRREASTALGPGLGTVAQNPVAERKAPTRQAPRTSTLRLASITILQRHAQVHMARATKKNDGRNWIAAALSMHGLYACHNYVEGVDDEGQFWGFYWRPGSALPRAMSEQARADFEAIATKHAAQEAAALHPRERH